MLNRILLLFENEVDKTNLLKTGKHLHDKYGAEVCGLYIKDIRKYEVLPPTLEGLVVDNSASILIKEWEKSEEIQVDELRKTFKEYFPLTNLMVEEGISLEIIQEKLLGFDLLVLEKGDTLTANQKEILRQHNKPLLLVPENVNLKIEKVMIANDKSERVNKSVFAFLNMFYKLDHFTSISVNLEDETDEEFIKYMEVAKKTLDVQELTGNPLDIILEKSNEFDILIMGDLKHSFFVERIAGNAGVKLLENIKIPIFIG
jgi:hypothetical protein